MAGYATDEDREAFATAIQGDTDDVNAETPEAPPDEEDTPDEGDEEGTGESTDDQDEGEPEEQAEGTSDDPTFAVQVDGQEVELPLSELTKGYLRQADYTRKVQFLARERDRLADADVIQQALESNPAETVKRIMRHYNLTPESFEGNEDGETTGPSPEAIRLMELERWQQNEIARQRQSHVDTEIDRLHREYGDFDEESLFTFAVERQIMDLEVALRAMTYGKPAVDRRVEKRKLAPMAGGNGHSSTTKPKAPQEEIRSFKDAYEAAKREVENSGS
jgi:hypothetical protein